HGLGIQVQQSECASQLRVRGEFLRLIIEAKRAGRAGTSKPPTAVHASAIVRHPRNRGRQMTTKPELIVQDLHVAVEGKEILKGLSLEVKKGEIHALMGPNGSGKSTFANTLMGHPRYEVTAGDILFKGESVLGMETD